MRIGLPITFQSAGAAIIVLVWANIQAVAGCPENSHVKPGTENNAEVICNCNEGYANVNRDGHCVLLTDAGCYEWTKTKSKRWLLVCAKKSGLHKGITYCYACESKNVSRACTRYEGGHKCALIADQ